MARNTTLSLEAELKLSLYKQQVKHPSPVSQVLAVSFISSQACCEHPAVTVLLKFSHLLSCPLFIACSQQLAESQHPALHFHRPLSSTLGELQTLPELSSVLVPQVPFSCWVCRYTGTCWATADAGVKEEKKARLVQFTHIFWFYLACSLIDSGCMFLQLSLWIPSGRAEDTVEY